MGNPIEDTIASAKKWLKLGAITIGAIILVRIFVGMFTTVELGHIVVYQNTFTGKSKVYHGPDFIIKPPFISNTTDYKKDVTISYEPGGLQDDYTSTNGPIKVAFADTYKAHVIMNARMVMPLSDEQVLKLHEAFRSQDNLVLSLYNKTLVDVVTNTATQFTAEEIFQGGLNGLKSAIEDQANNGVYVTQRRKIISEMGVTDRVEPGEKKTGSTATAKPVYVWKAIPTKDHNGKVMRTSNPFSQYGVQVTQVNLAEPEPEKLLEKLLNEKKSLVAKKISSIQKQENAKTEIETAKLEGEAKRVKAEQERLIAADAAVIDKKKEVQLAKQDALKEIVDRQKLADLAVIDKKKELQIATSNEDIEKANERAAKYKAEAIKHEGLAKAEVKKANYLAIDKTVFRLEVERDISRFKYAALPNVKVEMPHNVFVSGGDKGTTAIDDLANMSIIDKVGNISTK